VHFHESEIEHAPNLPDHHSYHVEQFPQFHNWPVVKHDHGPIFHGQYQFQHHDWTSPHFTGIADYFHDDSKAFKHVETLPTFRPDFGMDLPYNEAAKSSYDTQTGPAPHAGARKPTTSARAQRRSEREVNYFVDGAGHVTRLS